MFRWIRTWLKKRKNPNVNPNFHYLMAADTVHKDLKGYEVVYAKDQPEYLPLATIRSNYRDGAVLSRWPLTREQRKAVANGADIYLELLTFGHTLHPIKMFVTDVLNVEYIKADYGLKTVAEKENSKS